MVTSGSDATLDLAGSACPHAGVLVISRFPSDIDPLYLLGIMNSPVFWSFVQGTMPTMGNGRHVIRRGPLAQFSVALSERSTQSEIAHNVRQLMETSDEYERTRLKQSVDAEVMKVYRVDSTADIDSNTPARKFKSRQQSPSQPLAGFDVTNQSGRRDLN
jgi:hypothetical protein